MLSLMSMKMRVLMLPGVAAVGFVLMYGVYLLFSAQHVSLLRAVSEDHAVSVRQQTELATALDRYQDAMKVAERGDRLALTEVRSARERVLEAFGERALAGGSGELQALRGRFERVAGAHLSALQADDRSDGPMEAVRLELDELQAVQGEVDGQLLTAWRDLESAVEAGELLHEQARVGFGLAVLLTIGVLGVISELVARSVAAPLVEVVTSAGTVSNEIATAVQQQSTTIQQTASSVTETTTTIEELRQTSEMTALKSREVMVAAERSLATADATLTSARAGDTAMRGIRDDVAGIAARILELSDKHIRISEIVASVNDIAEQSNLLAVNASIEAAKAGDAGRGFAVVASEVRTLAAKSKEATRQIRTLLGEIQKASNAAVMVTEQGTKRVDEGASLITELGRSIEEFRAVIEENAAMARQISLATQQQEGGLVQISSAMRAIDDASQESAMGARQLEQAAGQVMTVSQRVQRVVFGGT